MGDGKLFWVFGYFGFVFVGLVIGVVVVSFRYFSGLLVGVGSV